VLNECLNAEGQNPRLRYWEKRKEILCSLTSSISIFADTHENGVKKTAKTRKHVHL